MCVKAIPHPCIGRLLLSLTCYARGQSWGLVHLKQTLHHGATSLHLEFYRLLSFHTVLLHTGVFLTHFREYVTFLCTLSFPYLQLQDPKPSFQICPVAALRTCLLFHQNSTSRHLSGHRQKQCLLLNVSLANLKYTPESNHKSWVVY